jgi:mannose-6-phosphate isomerase-like protein (cupin superfamily)
MDRDIARRVITGVDSNGRSCVISDGAAATVLRFPPNPKPNSNWSVVNWVWSTDDSPPIPLDGPPDERTPAEWFPGPGGTRFIVETLGPYFGVNPATPDEMESGADPMAAVGMNFNARYIDGIGVHSSDTIDYAVVISGRLWLETTDGNEVVLEAGDCVVQMGVRHTWRNRDSEPARVAFIIVGANRVSDPETALDGGTGG